MSRNLSQYPAHDLAGSCFGKPIGPLDLVRCCDGSDLFADGGNEVFLQRVGLFNVVVQRHIGKDALALDIVRETDNGCFSDIGMQCKCAFDFGGSQPVTGNVDDVVDPAGDLIVAVRIALGAVTGEVVPGVQDEIVFLVQVRVAYIPLNMPGQAVLMQSAPFPDPVISFPSSSMMARHNAEERHHCLGRFDVDCAGQWENHVSAVLRLPPGVDDRATATADLVVEPPPGFGIQRFADGAQNAQ